MKHKRKVKKSLFRFFGADRRSSSLMAVAAILVFAGIGAYMLAASHAATPAASVEAENGTVSSSASAVSDSTASGGSAVKFGQASSSGGTCASSVKNDADGPDPWGGCWPGPSNTGVPPGTTLQRVPQDVTSGTGWAWNAAAQGVFVTSDNVVVSGLNVAGGIEVEANGVTVKNSMAENMDFAGYRYPGARVTFSHVTIDCKGSSSNEGTSGMGQDGINVDHANILHCENGMDDDQNFTVTDSYIHDAYTGTPGVDDPHTDGIQSAFSNNFIVRHNTIYSANGSAESQFGTSAMINNPTGTDGTFDKNLVAGGAYTYYCVRGTAVRQSITNNLFSKKYIASVGYFGPTDSCNVAGNTFTGNMFVVPGQAPSGAVPAE